MNKFRWAPVAKKSLRLSIEPIRLNTCMTRALSLGLLMLLGKGAWAADCNTVGDTWHVQSGECQVTLSENTVTLGKNNNNALSPATFNVIALENGTQLTFTNPLTLNIKANDQAHNSEFSGILGSAATIKGDALTLNINPEGKEVQRTKGIHINENSSLTLAGLTENMTVNASGDAQNFDIRGASAETGFEVNHGLLIGQGGSSSAHAVINGDTQIDIADLSKMKVFVTAKNLYPDPKNIRPAAYHVSAIRVINGDSSFESNGKLSVTIDSQNNPIPYDVGLYVSGSDAKVQLNGASSITLKTKADEGLYDVHGKVSVLFFSIKGQAQRDASEFKELIRVLGFSGGSASSAIEIGKLRDVGTGRGGVWVGQKGSLNIDTTQAKQSPAIRILGTNNLLDASQAQNLSSIHSAAEVVLFDNRDLLTVNKGDKGSAVKLNNAVLKSGEQSPIVYTKAGIAQSSVELSGALSNAVASERSWIASVQKETADVLDVRSPAQYLSKATETIEAGELAVSLRDHAVAQGLMAYEKVGEHSVNQTYEVKPSNLDEAIDNCGGLAKRDVACVMKNIKFVATRSQGETVKDTTAAKLNITVDSDAQWQLKKNASDALKGADQYRSLVTTLNLKNGGTLDAARHASDNKDGYFVRIQSYDADMNPVVGTLKSNAGVINLTQFKSVIPNGEKLDPAKDIFADRLTIEGNYDGQQSAKIYMDTHWDKEGDYNGANAKSDLLHITGIATGQTEVIPMGVDGQPGFIDGTVKAINGVINTVPVVQVDGGSDPGTFYGKAKVAGRLLEAQLTSSSSNPYVAKEQHDEDITKKGQQKYYYWTLSTKVIPATPLVPGKTQDPAIVPTPRVPIYDSATSGYVQTPSLDLELGYASIATLNQRQGDNLGLAWDACGCLQKNIKAQTWGRALAGYLKLDGKNRFNTEQKQYGVQFGHDFDVNHNSETGTRTHTGAYITYIRAENQFSDSLRTQNGIIQSDKYTGKAHTDWVSLGLHHTRYAGSGAYLDIDGQFSYLNNQYQARDNRKTIHQSGYGVAVSAEVGRPWQFSHTSWIVEPQAQLVYQFLHLNQFNDGIRAVRQGNVQGLRGRAGVRFAHYGDHQKMTQSFYAEANVYHDFFKPSAIHTDGGDYLSERYGSTWAEVGIGADIPFSSKGRVYADLRYEHSFSKPMREGFRGSVGLKYSWK